MHFMYLFLQFFSIFDLAFGDYFLNQTNPTYIYTISHYLSSDQRDSVRGALNGLEWPRLWRITDLSLVVNKEGRRKYENSHKNVFGLSIVLESKVEHSKILSF